MQFPGFLIFQNPRTSHGTLQVFLIRQETISKIQSLKPQRGLGSTLTRISKCLAKPLEQWYNKSSNSHASEIAHLIQLKFAR